MISLCMFGKIHPLVQKRSYIQEYDLKKDVKVTINLTCLDSATMI